MVYAAIQQYGGQAGRGHKVTIPLRPFLPVTRLYAGTGSGSHRHRQSAT